MYRSTHNSLATRFTGANTTDPFLPILPYHRLMSQNILPPLLFLFISRIFQISENTIVPRSRGTSSPKTASRTQPYRQVPQVCRPPWPQLWAYLVYAAPPGGDITARSTAGPRSSRRLPSASSPRIYPPSYCHLPRFLTPIHSDLAFGFASTATSALSHHGYKFLIFASIVEGILGGQATLQAAISAYISDCTSDGSRAHIFSRFMGVSYVGFSLGPTIGAFFIRNPLLQIQSFGSRHHKMPSVTAAFWAAILFSTINLILALLVIPESLDKTRRRVEQKGGAPVPTMQTEPGLKKRLLAPLAIFAPQRRIVNGRMQEDWSMLWLATTVFLLLLASVRN